MAEKQKRERLKDFGVRIKQAEVGQVFGPPPYDTPSKVPFMLRALVGLNAGTARVTDGESRAVTVRELEKFKHEGVIPPGSFKAWGIKFHECYAHIDPDSFPDQALLPVVSSSSATRKRENHHLSETTHRVAFLEQWRKFLKNNGFCDGANALSRFLMIINPPSSAPLVKSPGLAQDTRDLVAKTAYEWLYMFVKDHNLQNATNEKGELLLDWYPPGAKKTVAAPPPAPVVSGFVPGVIAERKRKMSAEESRRKLIETRDEENKLVGAGSGGGIALPKPEEPEKRQNKRKNAEFSDAPNLPEGARKALNDYAKQHGFGFVHARVVSSRHVEAYLVRRESDPVGFRVSARSTLLGRWSVVPSHGLAEKRDNGVGCGCDE